MSRQWQQIANDNKIIASANNMTDQEFLQSMSTTDVIDHADNCGHCYYRQIMADVAREMLAAGETENVIDRWSELCDERWSNSKYVKLWEEAKQNGLDPHKVFEDRGWEP